MQGRFLVEVAAVQRGNLGSGFRVRSVRFLAESLVELAVQLPTGRAAEVRAGIATSAAELCRVLGEVGPPFEPDRYDLPVREPAPVMVAELLRDLGSNADVLVSYRPDLAPLAFARIEAGNDDGATYFLIDREGRQYGFRYTWNDMSMPMTADLHGVVDMIADGRAGELTHLS